MSKLTTYKVNGLRAANLECLSIRISGKSYPSKAGKIPEYVFHT